MDILSVGWIHGGAGILFGAFRPSACSRDDRGCSSPAGPNKSGGGNHGACYCSLGIQSYADYRTVHPLCHRGSRNHRRADYHGAKHHNGGCKRERRRLAVDSGERGELAARKIFGQDSTGTKLQSGRQGAKARTRHDCRSERGWRRLVGLFGLPFGGEADAVV